MKKQYFLVNTGFRKVVDLRDYEMVIMRAYRSVMPWVRVEVFQEYYTVEGKWSNFQARKVGKLLGKTALGRYSVYHGTRAQMFKSKQIA